MAGTPPALGWRDAKAPALRGLRRGPCGGAGLRHPRPRKRVAGVVGELRQAQARQSGRRLRRFLPEPPQARADPPGERRRLGPKGRGDRCSAMNRKIALEARPRASWNSRCPVAPRATTSLPAHPRCRSVDGGEWSAGKDSTASGFDGSYRVAIRYPESTNWEANRYPSSTKRLSGSYRLAQ